MLAKNAEMRAAQLAIPHYTLITRTITTSETKNQKMFRYSAPNVTTKPDVGEVPEIYTMLEWRDLQ